MERCPKSPKIYDAREINVYDTILNRLAYILQAH